MTMTVTQESLKRLPAQHDMCGQFLGYPLTIAETTIKAGLVKRLVRYAVQRAEDLGLPVWDKVNVCCIDGESYFVEFINPKGTKITLNGILIGRGGHPSVDHRFTIEE